jgi:hypothetical protein
MSDAGAMLPIGILIGHMRNRQNRLIRRPSPEYGRGGGNLTGLSYLSAYRRRRRRIFLLSALRSDTLVTTQLQYFPSHSEVNMKPCFGAILAVLLLSGMTLLGWAGEAADAQAVLDKGIKAMGGADKLGAVKAVTWKAKGKISFGGNESDFQTTVFIQGLDQYRSEFEGQFGDNKFKGITVLNGGKGWRKFGEMNMELADDRLANEKRAVYLQLVPATLVPLKGKGFKVESGGAEKIDGKAAAILKVTAPDGKNFKLSLDQASGLPVKLVANVLNFGGEEVTQETTFAGYKDFGGIKKATKIEMKRDGDRFMEQDVVEFRVLDKIDARTFTEPE